MTFYDDLITAADDDNRALVRVERNADRAVVTLDQPEKLNALSASLTRQLKASLEELVADRQISAIVLTGTDPGSSQHSTDQRPALALPGR